MQEFEKIFGHRFFRTKPSARLEPSWFQRLFAGRGKTWKRAFFLVPMLAGLFLVMLAEHGSPAFSRVSLATLVDILQDPLNLFDERSPGGRSPGALLSIKPPKERVLSTIRDREPPPGIPPEMANPIFTAPTEGLPAIGPIPEPGNAGPAFGAPLLPPLLPLGFNRLPDDQLPPPQLLPPPSPPENGPEVPTPPEPPLAPPIIVTIPEPATWALMILAGLALGLRRRLRKQTAP